MGSAISGTGKDSLNQAFTLSSSQLRYLNTPSSPRFSTMASVSASFAWPRSGLCFSRSIHSASSQLQAMDATITTTNFGWPQA